MPWASVEGGAGVEPTHQHNLRWSLLSLAQMPRRTTGRGYEIVMGETGIEPAF